MARPFGLIQAGPKVHKNQPQGVQFCRPCMRPVSLIQPPLASYTAPRKCTKSNPKVYNSGALVGSQWPQTCLQQLPPPTHPKCTLSELFACARALGRAARYDSRRVTLSVLSRGRGSVRVLPRLLQCSLSGARLVRVLPRPFQCSGMGSLVRLWFSSSVVVL